MTPVLQENSAFVKFSCHKNTEIESSHDEIKDFMKALSESTNLETLVSKLAFCHPLGIPNFTHIDITLKSFIDNPIKTLSSKLRQSLKSQPPTVTLIHSITSSPLKES